MLAIETVGRRTGKRRTTVVTYLRGGDSWVVMPINAGSHRTPGWWLNLKQAGTANIVVAGRRVRVQLRIAQGQDRDDLWCAYVRQAPVMSGYARLTSREVPVAVLEPISQSFPTGFD